MDQTTISMMLMIIGALLMIAEAFSPGIFMLIPGTILVFLGIVGVFSPDFLFSWYSPIVGLLLAIPVTVMTLKIYQRLGEPEPPTTTVAESLVGREGVVTVDTVPGNLRGKVKIENEIWSATSEKPIPAGKKVVVIHSEGVHVRVEESV
ncbi:MAG: NfeD family protein [Thermoplasmatales archaeon]|jgi:membrane protein implicated in regulation of membrane protease activity|nr:NfeD family protein [Thermoplasmatales archaeon]